MYTQVRNLTHTSAISANYVDESNFDRAVAELRVAALASQARADLCGRFWWSNWRRYALHSSR